MSSTSPLSILSKPKAVELGLHCSRGMLLRVSNLPLFVLTLLQIDPGIYLCYKPSLFMFFYGFFYPLYLITLAPTFILLLILLQSVCFVLSLMLSSCEEKRKFVRCIKMHDYSSCQPHPSAFLLDWSTWYQKKKLQVKKLVPIQKIFSSSFSTPLRKDILIHIAALQVDESSNRWSWIRLIYLQPRCALTRQNNI